jgi:chromosomal replication initiator protein
MQTCNEQDTWSQFLEFAKKNCSPTEFQNWLTPIKVIETTATKIVLEVPNVFVKEYLLDNYKQILTQFLPTTASGAPAIEFILPEELPKQPIIPVAPAPKKKSADSFNLNQSYTFENFIEGPSNQFVKSAALGVAHNPGKSFNPLFIHGGVGLGKTHLLHGIGHFISKTKKQVRIKCITTESFINDIVNNLRNKSIDKMKKFYRTLDVLLVDDIQFLQNRLNFEEEFCNTFEALINQNKQIVITSDNPPSKLKLSERIIARMEWGLVAHIGVPELETRVAIIQHKSSIKHFDIPNDVAFFIADHIYSNVRQLEGAINRLSAFSRLTNAKVTLDFAEKLLKELLNNTTASHKVTVEAILKSIASVFEVKVSELKGESRHKNIATARQSAMYLAKELITEDSLSKIASSFGGKTHSTLIHAWKKIQKLLPTDTRLKKQIDLVRRNIN